MGFKWSGVAFGESGSVHVLGGVGGVEPGEDMDVPVETELCIAELPNNWILICAEDFMYAAPDESFPDEGNMARLSAKGRVLGCMFHEGIMCSVASMYEYGKELWCVIYNCNDEEYNLRTSETLPDNFEAVYERLKADQDKFDLAGKPVDALFDIPIEIAFQICGYKYDLAEFEWGEPKFTMVELK